MAKANRRPRPRWLGGWLIGAGLVISLVLAGFISFYASSSPDGLEKVAADHGFVEQAQDSAVAAIPTADYGIAGVESERLSVGLAGVLGVIVMIVIAFGLFALITRGKKAINGTAEPTSQSHARHS